MQGIWFDVSSPGTTIVSRSTSVTCPKLIWPGDLLMTKGLSALHAVEIKNSKLTSLQRRARYSHSQQENTRRQYRPISGGFLYNWHLSSTTNFCVSLDTNCLEKGLKTCSEDVKQSSLKYKETRGDMTSWQYFLRGPCCTALVYEPYVTWCDGHYFECSFSLMRAHNGSVWQCLANHWQTRAAHLPQDNLTTTFWF